MGHHLENKHARNRSFKRQRQREREEVSNGKDREKGIKRTFEEILLKCLKFHEH